jgi:spermidine synthase
MSESTAALPAGRVAAPAPPAATAALPVDPAFVVALLFFVSGGASLLLETAAVRAFVELFGSAAASLGAIGGAFLVCLALGAVALGPLADRSRRPLRLYALLESVACLGGLLALQGFARLDAVATAFARAEVAGAPQVALRLLVAVALLIVPVGAMGGTLPVLARLRRGLVGRAAAAGVLQAANALGAAVGAFVGGAFLLAALGTRGTWMLAAGLSGAIAVVAWALGRAADAAPAPAPQAVARDPAALPRAPLLVLVSACLGFALLGSEVLLFRGLAQLVRGGHDTLGALLAAFLLGGALGSEAGVLLARDVRRARDGLQLGMLLSALTPLVALLWLRAASVVDDTSFLHFGVSALSWSARLFQEFLGALLIAGPVAFALALPFPAACELHPGDDRRFGRAVAWLSGAWSAGAAAAGLIVPALLLPALKVRGALLFCAAVPVVALVLLETLGRGRLVARRMPLVIGATAAGAALLLVPVAGATLLRDPILFAGRVGAATGARLIAYNEDALANVAVFMREDGSTLLAVDDQMALGGSGASKVEAMQAAVPRLLHPGPVRALVLGLGAGITAGALRDLGVPEIDAVELLPLVRSALPLFAAENGSIQNDPRIHLHTIDARAFVRAAEPASYDLIIGDLYFPWQPEAGLLYTREHFERVRRLLRPGGLFCQWLPGHQLRWEELGRVGRTFVDVFPGTTVWLARHDFDFPVLGLVAGTDRLEIDVHAIEERITSPIQGYLKSLGIVDAPGFLSLYVGDEWFFRDRFADVGLNTEDRASVEFEAARRIETDPVVALYNRQRLNEVHEDVAGRMKRSSLENRDRVELQRELDAASRRSWRLFDAETMLLLARANRSLPPAQRKNVPEELEAKAFQELGGALVSKPDDAPTLDLLAQLLRQELEAKNFSLVVEGVLTLEAQQKLGVNARLRNLRGMAFLMAVCDPDPRQAAQFKNPLELAVKDFRKAIELDPQLVEASVHLGLALFLTGTREAWDEARGVLAAAREKILAPTHPDGHGLPYEAEAVLVYLNGGRADAIAALQRGPKSPWAEKILQAMVAAAR